MDKRADIWAFGVVLYEMLTGKRLFDGETISDTLAAVLTKEPDLTQVPAKVRRLLEACLQKDPRQRLHDIGDWKTAAGGRSAGRTRETEQTAVDLGCGFHRRGALAGLDRVPPRYRRARAYSDCPCCLRKRRNFANSPAVSPDGRRLAFIAVQDNKRELWIRDMDSAALHLLPGTEGASYPFWSPDSRSHRFLRGRKSKEDRSLGRSRASLCVMPPTLAAAPGARAATSYTPLDYTGCRPLPLPGSAVELRRRLRNWIGRQEKTLIACHGFCRTASTSFTRRGIMRRRRMRCTPANWIPRSESVF